MVIEGSDVSVQVTCETEVKCVATLRENSRNLHDNGIVVVSAVDRDTGSGNAAPFKFSLVPTSDENGQFLHL